MCEDRAVSTTLGYVLTLAISALLVTGLITAGGNYVDTQREQVVHDELSVIGQQVAADAERVDRLLDAATNPGGIWVNQTFSDTVTGSSYRIQFQDPPSGPDLIVVESFEPEIEVRIATSATLKESSSDGGPIQIKYTGSGSELEVIDV